MLPIAAKDSIDSLFVQSGQKVEGIIMNLPESSLEEVLKGLDRSVSGGLFYNLTTKKAILMGSKATW